MPQFAPPRTQPLKPNDYRRLARLARLCIERIEAAADADDPREKKARTDALNRLHGLALHYWHRHHGRNPDRERTEEHERRRLEDAARGL
jgi:hypothetical protein